MNKVIVKIYGGLGNQMFQYAAGRSLALRHNVPLYLDASWFLSEPSTREAHAVFQLFQFPRIIHTVSGIVGSFPYSREDAYLVRKIKKFMAKDCYFAKKIKKFIYNYDIFKESRQNYCPEFETISPSVMLDGYWSSEKYFNTFEKQIREDFTLTHTLIHSRVRNLAEKISMTPNSISLHIRRGDYLKLQHIYNILGLEYYQKALDIFYEKYGSSTVFIFSNDPEWVRNNFHAKNHRFVLVDCNFNESPLNDLYLQTLCRHHIIANSTFSWWGARLGDVQGTTIAPKKFFIDRPYDDYKDFYCDGWMVI